MIQIKIKSPEINTQMSLTVSVCFALHTSVLWRLKDDLFDYISSVWCGNFSLFWFHFLWWKGGYVKDWINFLYFAWIVVPSLGLLVFQSQGGSPLLHNIITIDSSDWTNLIWKNWINFPSVISVTILIPFQKRETLLWQKPRSNEKTLK